MRRLFRVGFLFSSLIAVFFLYQSPAQQAIVREKPQKTFKDMQKAMQQLAIDSKQILSTLKPLSKKQKNAVIALITIMRASAVYESFFKNKNDSALRLLYAPLKEFSTAYTAPRKFQDFSDPYNQAVIDCLSALKKCEDGKTNPNYDCDNDPHVMVPCANEIILFTEQFKQLHNGLPKILDGMDPWPPISPPH